MKIVLGDIEEAPLKEVEGELTGRGAEAIGVVTDVSDAASVAELRDRALDRFGAVHLVHNNAGIGMGGPIWEVSEEDWRWILGVNLWGVVHGVATFVPLLHRAGRGARGQHGVDRRPRHRAVPRPLQRHQAGGGRHLRDALQGPPGGGAPPASASRSCAPASSRHASPSPTATVPTGRPTARSRAPRTMRGADPGHGRRRHPSLGRGRSGHRRRARRHLLHPHPPRADAALHDTLRRHHAGAAAERRSPSADGRAPRRAQRPRSARA